MNLALTLFNVSFSENPLHYPCHEHLLKKALHMCFACLMCKSDGLLLNHDGLIAANVMLGLVPMAA